MSRLQRLVEAEFGRLVWTGLALSQQLALLQHGKPVGKRFSSSKRAERTPRAAIPCATISARCVSKVGSVIGQVLQRAQPRVTGGRSCAPSACPASGTRSRRTASGNFQPLGTAARLLGQRELQHAVFVLGLGA